MTWLKLDDRLDEHPKLTRTNGDYDAALSTFVQCCLYCARNLTDGEIPARVMVRFDKRIVSILAEPFDDRPGMLESHEDGSCTVHDYLVYNPSRAQIMAERERNRVRQEKFRASGGPDVSNGSSNAVSATVGNTPPVPVLDLDPDPDPDLKIPTPSAREASTPLGDISTVGSEWERLTGQSAPEHSLVALCATHPTERIVEGIRRASEAGKPKVAYVAGIVRGLAAENWTPEIIASAEPNPYFGLCGETK